MIYKSAEVKHIIIDPKTPALDQDKNENVIFFNLNSTSSES